MSESLNFPTVMPSLLLDFANRKSLDPRITFTRASTATYYDEDTVALAEQNLLIRSQEFDNAAWNKLAATVTANLTTAPDGSSTADTLTESATTAEHYIFPSNNISFLSGQNYTFSCFVKPNGRNWFRLAFASTAFPSAERFAFFDVQNGVLGTVAPNITATITAAGNGWYRCSISRAATASASAVVFLVICDADNSTNYTGDGTSGLYLWGAQLEQRSAVTAYTATTTAPITNYIPVLMTAAVGVPRFIFNPTTRESLGLLIEEQRTNLLTYSEDFSNAAWTKSNSSITANTIVAPDGTLTGDKLVENTATAEHRTDQAFTFSAGLSYVFSFYAKAAERTFLAASLRHNGSDNGAFINLTTGAISAFGSATTVVTDVGNGWWRISIAGTSATASTAYVRISLASSISTTTYTGNGFSGIYIWGAQLEAGAFATSYIPTVASSATRSADAASMTGVNFSEWYKASEGTLFAEWSQAQTASTTRVFQVDDGSSNNRIYVGASSIGATTVVANNSTQAALGVGAVSANIFTKVIGCYKVNDFAMSTNASSASTDTSGIIPTVDRARIGVSETAFYVNGTIKKIAYYPWRLTNAQLQALTS